MAKTPTMPTQMRLSEAIKQLREELRTAARERENAQDIIFTADKIELELGVTFGLEAEAGVGFKLLAFLDVSAKGKASEQSAHKIKFTFDITDADGKKVKVKGTKPE